MKGFFHRLALIDLTLQKVDVVPIDPALALAYLGGKGLGTHLLLEHTPAQADPLSPENCMIIGTGPVTDSRIRGSCRFGLFSKSPLTGSYAESYSGGKVAIAISRTGYDFILLKGASTGPVWLEISDRDIIFHDARALWGRDTHETEETVRARCGQKGCGALVIGPAGENLVRFAVVGHTHWRTPGQTGMGAVMGAKRIKALVFHGETRQRFHAPEAMAAYAKKKSKGLKLEGTEAETICPFGGLCQIHSSRDIARLNEICDRLGLDTISAGNLAALTVEASRQGKIQARFEYGDAHSIAGLLHKIARREGIGGLLAEGIQSAGVEMDMAARITDTSRRFNIREGLSHAGDTPAAAAD